MGLLTGPGPSLTLRATTSPVLMDLVRVNALGEDGGCDASRAEHRRSPSFITGSSMSMRRWGGSIQVHLTARAPRLHRKPCGS